MGGFLISGALLYDGTLRVPRPADVAVEGERIKAVAQAGALAAPGFRRIEARGLSLAPGFIDAHSHSDVSILAAPEASGKISQGVTTEIVGNCGLSAFPVLTETVREHLNTLYAACGIRVTWNDLNGYTWPNTFASNAIAVLLEHAATPVVLDFSGSHFTGNGTDIENRCGQPLDISQAIFE